MVAPLWEFCSVPTDTLPLYPLDSSSLPLQFGEWFGGGGVDCPLQEGEEGAGAGKVGLSSGQLVWLVKKTLLKHGYDWGQGDLVWVLPTALSDHDVKYVVSGS